MTISPLEASVRVSGSEATSASTAVRRPAGRRASCWAATCCSAGSSISRSRTCRGMAWFRVGDRLLDFLGLPLFLYGVATLLASKRERIQHVMAPVLRPIGGVLGRFALRHMSAKPHRTVAFLLIVALMSSVSLYPIVTSRSFEDKAVRGAKVQIGTDWQVLYNAPDLIDVDRLNGPAGDADRSAQAGNRQAARVAAAGRRAYATRPTWSSPCFRRFYLPGYGLRGVPLFLLGNPDDVPYDRLRRAERRAERDVRRHPGAHEHGDVAVSPPVADFWRLGPGHADSSRPRRGAPCNRVEHRRHPRVPARHPAQERQRPPGLRAGAHRLSELPVQHERVPGDRDRQPEAEAAANPAAAGHRAAQGRSGRRSPSRSRKRSPGRTPFLPLEIHSLTQEVAKVGSDMYISLALANMRIYLIGGLILAARGDPGDRDGQLQRGSPHARRCCGSAARRRRRCAGSSSRCCSRRRWWGSRSARRRQCWPASVLPTTSGSCARSARSCSCCRPTSSCRVLTAWIALLLIFLLVGVASGFSWWVYRHTAHQLDAGRLIRTGRANGRPG